MAVPYVGLGFRWVDRERVDLMREEKRQEGEKAWIRIQQTFLEYPRCATVSPCLQSTHNPDNGWLMNKTLPLKKGNSNLLNPFLFRGLIP